MNFSEALFKGEFDPLRPYEGFWATLSTENLPSFIHKESELWSLLLERQTMPCFFDADANREKITILDLGHDWIYFKRVGSDKGYAIHWSLLPRPTEE